MPDCSLKVFSWTAFWLSIFIMTVVIAVIPLYDFLPAECLIKQVNFTDTKQLTKLLRQSNHNHPSFCNISFSVTVITDTASYNATATFRDSENDSSQCQRFIDQAIVGRNQSCWYSRNNPQDVFFAPGMNDDFDSAINFFDKIALSAIFLASVFGLCTLISASFAFKPELMRCCPRFVLTAIINLNARFTRHTSPPNPLPPGPPQNHQRSRPAAVVSRKRIFDLVESTKLSEEQARMLHMHGWSCCICLEERMEQGQLLPVSRLQCNHATHSECLQLWLEKGRAVCCLCNAELFPRESKADDSTESSASGYDGAPPGSLEVERTEGALSSPATSVFIDLSQPRVAGPSQTEERNEQSSLSNIP